MAKGFKHGAGGSNVLNFKVVGNPQPTNPRENTVWVDTDIQIPNWYMISNDPNLAKSFSSLSGTIWNGVLFIDVELKPKTTYTLSFDGVAGHKYYVNEHIASDYPIFEVTSDRVVVSFTTKDTLDKSNTSQYGSGLGWTLLKNRQEQPSTPRFDNLCLIEGKTGIINGFVWISTGVYSTSAFNALKNNGIQVYPSYAKQYVNGSWVTKEVKIYQGGAWKQPWDGKLFSGGAFRVISGLNGTGVGATVRIEGSNLFINADNEYAWPYSIERIDLTGVKTIVVKMESPSHTWNNRPWGGFGVCKNIPTGGSSIDAAYKHFNTTDPRGEYALDVSGLNGEYYLAFAIADTSAKGAVYYISEIRLER